MPSAIERVLSTIFAPHQRSLRSYRIWVEKQPIRPKTILLEQQNGLSLDGNIYCILRELLSDKRYEDYSVSFVSGPETFQQFSQELVSRGLIVPVLVRGTKDYLHALATTSIIITDNCLPPYYVKRCNQTLVNTWHGIPLKTLGRREVMDAYRIGNIQRNFAQCDYLVMPNETTERRMIRDYMIVGLGSPTILPLGYPRNEAFLGPKTSLFKTEKRAYAWLPTFRGVGDNRGTRATNLPQILEQINDLLNDDETLYLKLHLVDQQQINLRHYSHIEWVPSNRELYEFLCDCDVLITDYSSVLFDYPLCGKKVVLFPYDREDYLIERGLYSALETLPFPLTTTVHDLVSELRSPIDYDDEPFLQQWWPYPTANSTRTLCERLLFDIGPLDGEHRISTPDCPTVLIYSELDTDLDELRGELLMLCEHYSPRLAFPWANGRDNEAFLSSLPDTVQFTPLKGELLSTLLEKGFVKMGLTKAVYDLDCRRAFGSARFSKVIIHDGTDKRWLRLMQAIQYS